MSGIIKPVFYEPLRHIYKMLFNNRYRTYSVLESKLRKIPRFTQCTARINGWDLALPDSASFLFAYREIFLKRIYEFRSPDPAPYIIDLGSNVGLSVLFFKSLYPNSRITALEADPDIYAFLKKNVHGNGFEDVNLLNLAAWHENTKIKFNVEGADGGRVSFEDQPDLIEVKAIDTSELLINQSVDFLKMDIEGAEDVVLPACQNHLSNVKFIFVEYHSRIGQPQSLSDILKILTDAGFRIHVHSVVCSPSPFMETQSNSGFDLNLNVFGWRDD